MTKETEKKNSAAPKADKAKAPKTPEKGAPLSDESLDSVAGGRVNTFI